MNNNFQIQECVYLVEWYMIKINRIFKLAEGCSVMGTNFPG